LTIQRKRVAKRLMSGLVAGALAIGGLAISGGGASARTPAAETTKRIAGDDRYETAVEVARKYSAPGGNGLIIASGESPYDALAASALAGLKTSPILLTKSDSLPESVADFLSDYKTAIQTSIAKTIYILGGTSAVSDDVVDAIKAIVHAGDALTPITVTRLGGADRYETAKLISEVPGLMLATDRLILVNGTNWADALSVASLAADNKWPVVLTGNGGLNATAKAVITKYQALPGSVDKYLVVGGPAVMPSSVEEYLDSTLTPMANIVRRGGANRYQTNYLLNVYSLPALMLGGAGSVAGTFTGSKVAMVSGTSPWDALSAGPWAALSGNGHHVVLTSSPAPSGDAVGLVGLLSQAFNKPAEVWIVGGKAAVADSIRTALVATAQSTDRPGPTLTGCIAGRTSFTATFPKALNSAENSAVTTTASNALWSVNAVKDSTTDGLITGFAELDVDAAGTGQNHTTYKVSGAKLVAGEVIKFAGILEDGATYFRNVGAGTCTVEADLTPPTATVKAVADATGSFDHFIVTLSEAIGNAGSATVASLSAKDYWKKTDGATSIWTSGKYQTLAATALDAAGLVYKVSFAAGSGSTAVSLPATTVVTLKKEALADLAGNGATLDINTTAAADVTKSTFSIASIVCNEDNGGVNAIFTRGGLTVAAKGSAALGAYGGRAGNAFKLRVVSQRGLIIPTVTVDAAASLITVTMDTNYHTAADVVTVAGNTGADANFTFQGSTAVTATVADLSSGTKGKDDCAATVLYSEPSTIASGELTIDGVAIAGETGYNTAAPATAMVVRFETTTAGNAAAVISGTTSDTQGTALTNTMSASSTLP